MYPSCIVARLWIALHLTQPYPTIRQMEVHHHFNSSFINAVECFNYLWFTVWFIWFLLALIFTGLFNTNYPRVDPSVIMLVLNSSQTHCLLARKKNFHSDMWFCLSGYLEPGKSTIHYQHLNNIRKALKYIYNSF